MVGAAVAGVGDVNGDRRPDVAESGGQTDAVVVFGGQRTGTVDTRPLGSAGFLIRRSRGQGIISVNGLGDATADRIPDIGLGTQNEALSPRYDGADDLACGKRGLGSLAELLADAVDALPHGPRRFFTLESEGTRPWRSLPPAGRGGRGRARGTS